MNGVDARVAGRGSLVATVCPIERRASSTASPGREKRLAMVVLRDRLAMETGSREHANQRGVRVFVEGIDHHAPPRVRHGAIAKASRELRKEGDVDLAKALAFAGAPLLIAEAAGQIEAIEKLTAKTRGARLELLRGRACRRAEIANVHRGSADLHTFARRY